MLRRFTLSRQLFPLAIELDQSGWSECFFTFMVQRNDHTTRRIIQLPPEMVPHETLVMYVYVLKNRTRRIEDKTEGLSPWVGMDRVYREPHQAAAGDQWSAEAVDCLCLTTRLSKTRDTFSSSHQYVNRSRRALLTEKWVYSWLYL